MHLLKPIYKIIPVLRKFKTNLSNQGILFIDKTPKLFGLPFNYVLCLNLGMNHTTQHTTHFPPLH